MLTQGLSRVFAPGARNCSKYSFLNRNEQNISNSGLLTVRCGKPFSQPLQ